MKKTRLILLINLLILVAYTVYAYSTIKGHNAALGIMISLALYITFQVAINNILGTIFMLQKKKEIGKMFFISSGIVLLIGFSACWGGEIF